MKRIRKSITLILVAICVVALALPAASANPTDSPKSGLFQGRSTSRVRDGKEVYTGTIVFIGGRLSGRSTTFALTIDDATSDAEADRFLQVLKSKDQDGLLDAIRKERKGTLQIGSEIGQDLNIVRIEEGEEGGRKITAVLSRWMRFAELRAGSRTVDYPFSYLELVVDPKGKGAGTFIPLARIDFKEKRNEVEVENFGAFPANLMGVIRRRS